MASPIPDEEESERYANKRTVYTQENTEGTCISTRRFDDDALVRYEPTVPLRLLDHPFSDPILNGASSRRKLDFCHCIQQDITLSDPVNSRSRQKKTYSHKLHSKPSWAASRSSRINGVLPIASRAEWRTVAIVGILRFNDGAAGDS